MTELSIEPSRVDAPFPIFSMDVTRLLPQNWLADIEQAVGTLGYRTTLDGRSPTSREAAFGVTDLATVRVVDGIGVSERVPWLLSFYQQRCLSLANGLGLGQFGPSRNLISAVNINCHAIGERYEWHVDSNPLTGLLFASTLTPVDGGALVFRCDPAFDTLADWELRIQPTEGLLFLYDARRAAHCVEPIRNDSARISIPMNFYFADALDARPDGLDGYLYREEHHGVAR